MAELLPSATTRFVQIADAAHFSFLPLCRPLPRSFIFWQRRFAHTRESIALTPRSRKLSSPFLLACAEGVTLRSWPEPSS